MKTPIPRKKKNQRGKTKVKNSRKNSQSLFQYDFFPYLRPLSFVVLYIIIGLSLFLSLWINSNEPMKQMMILSIISLLLVILTIYMLLSKFKDFTHPFWILFLGISTTFIGFTLSTSLTELLKERETSQKVITSLTYVKNVYDNIDEQVSKTMNEADRGVFTKKEDKDSFPYVTYDFTYLQGQADIAIDLLEKEDNYKLLKSNLEIYNELSSRSQNQIINWDSILMEYGNDYLENTELNTISKTLQFTNDTPKSMIEIMDNWNYIRSILDNRRALLDYEINLARGKEKDSEKNFNNTVRKTVDIYASYSVDLSRFVEKFYPSN